MFFWLTAGFLLAGYYVGRKHEQWIRDNPSRKKWGITLLSFLMLWVIFIYLNMLRG